MADKIAGVKSRPVATSGASLVLVVLFTMLLLAGILAATLRLSLGSRQNTADQKATLQAQYAAESKLALAQSQIQDIQVMLARGKKQDDGNPAVDSSGNEIRYIQLASGTLKAKMEEYSRLFCGKTSVSGMWQDTNAFDKPRSTKDAVIYENAEECVVDSTATPDRMAFSVIADNMQNAAYQLLPIGEQPKSSDDKYQWWKNKFSFRGDSAKYDLKLDRVVKLTDYAYRFYIKLVSAGAISNSGTSSRYVDGKASKSASWWFEMRLPNPFDYVVFDNTLPGGAGFAANIFDGDFLLIRRSDSILMRM